MKRTAAKRAQTYHARRRAIIAHLGGCCVICHSTEQLEVDGINGHPRQPRSMARWNRIAMYERQAALGELQVLCKRCNASKGRLAFLAF